MSDTRLAAQDSFDNGNTTQDLFDPATPSSSTSPIPPPSRPIKVNTQPSRTHGAITAKYDPRTRLATGVTMEEYRRLNARCTEKGMYTGVLSGVGIAYGLKRYTTLSRNALTLTALLSATSISYLTAHILLRSSLSSIISSARAASLPQAEGSENAGPLLPDSALTHDTTLPIPSSEKSPAATLKNELASLGKGKERTRWAKGVGLDGEVEEEGEMRDTFFRPGVPRRGA